MYSKVVPLNNDHLDAMGHKDHESRLSYFSKGSLAYCLLVDGEPVFAGGIVNLSWHRGEAWMLPTPYFKKHVKICFRTLRTMIIKAAIAGGFKRVQATCTIFTSANLFEHLGFEYEGTLRHFGPNGETCHMYARFFG